MNEKIRTSRPPAKSPPVSVPGGPVANPLLKRWVPIGAALAVLVIVVVAVRAFMGGGHPTLFGRNAFRLLDLKPVQEELKLTAEQLAKITKIKDDKEDAMMWSNNRHLSEYEKDKKAEQLDLSAEKQLPWVLDAGQLKRLKELHFQQRGKRPWNDEEAAAALKLTRQQKDDLKSIQQQQRKEMGELRKGGGPGAKLDEAQKQEAKEKFDEMRKTQEAQLMGVLTAEQQEKWQQMRGEPFAGDLTMPRGGGRNAGGGGRNRGGP